MFLWTTGGWGGAGLRAVAGPVSRTSEGLQDPRQVVLTGGGAELAGIAEFAQGALGRPVRIGKPSQLRGLPDAHATPGFTTLAGLCLYAARDPVDIRSIPDTSQTMVT